MISAAARGGDNPVYIHPGQLAAGARRAFATILGSCVAVCLHDPIARVGGINHFVLPRGVSAGDRSPRYAPGAISQLLQRVLNHGASERRLVAHVLGGANVLAGFGAAEEHLGMRNARAARDLLAEHRITVISSHIGGTCGRRVLFHPADGTVAIQLLGTGHLVRA